MEQVLDRLDSPRGIVAYVVVLSLLTGLVVAVRGVLDGEVEVLGYFTVYVVTVVGVVAGATVAWERYLA